MTDEEAQILLWNVAYSREKGAKRGRRFHIFVQISLSKRRILQPVCGSHQGVLWGMWLNTFIQYHFERFLLNGKIDRKTGNKLQSLVWLTRPRSLNEKALRKKKTST